MNKPASVVMTQFVVCVSSDPWFQQWR